MEDSYSRQVAPNNSAAPRRWYPLPSGLGSAREALSALMAGCTDSTHVLAAVRDLNRLELAGESVRAALEALVAAAPDWVRAALDVPGWADRYGVRVDSWRLPTSKTKRDALAAAYGTDGFTLLGAVYAADSPPWLAQLPAVET